MHAAIDTRIHHNRIHDCSPGLWLDWQTQGTGISRNLFYRNSRDLFVEVSHGPYIAGHRELHRVDRPVYINNNAYFAGALPFEREENKLVVDGKAASIEIVERGDEVYLSCELPAEFEGFYGRVHSTPFLDRAATQE